MEDRGGRCELLLPYATLEPIRKMLLQNFMGEKFGRDNIWEGHLATELWSAPTTLRVVLDEFTQPLGKMMNLQVGDTIPVDLPEQARLGGFWAPQRGLAVVGQGRFEAFDPTRHVRRFGDVRRTPDFTHLEYVDPESLARSQREQQDFHLVRSRETGPRIDAVEQIFLFYQVH